MQDPWASPFAGSTRRRAPAPQAPAMPTSPGYRPSGLGQGAPQSAAHMVIQSERAPSPPPQTPAPIPAFNAHGMSPEEWARANATPTAPPTGYLPGGSSGNWTVDPNYQFQTPKWMADRMALWHPGLGVDMKTWLDMVPAAQRNTV